MATSLATSLATSPGVIAPPHPPVHRRLSAPALAALVTGWQSGGPAYAALADAVRGAVLSGTVAPNTRLPSERDLAVALGVSRTTTAAAYAALRERGFVTSRTGVGTVAVLPRPARRAQPQWCGGDAPVPVGVEPPEDLVDLGQAAPAAPPQLHAAYGRALEALPGYLSGRGYEPLGLQPLREAVAQRLTERGTPTTPDQVLVTTGAQHAIATVAQSLLGPRDRVVVQSPTYAHGIEAMVGRGARVVGFPVGAGLPGDGPGFDVALFESTIRAATPRLAYLVPDFHNPTGYSLTSDERAEVRRIALRHRVTVIGDETLTDIALDGPAPEPLAGDGSATSHLLTVGSASKTFWGGLRVGWVRAHPDVVAHLARVRGASDIATSVLEQLAVVELLARRDEVLAERLPLLRSQRDLLRSAVTAAIPSWHVTAPAGGLSLWVDLGRPLAHALAAAAAVRGLVVNPGPSLTPDGAATSRVRLTFAPDAEAIRRAVPRLVAAWEHVTG
ncbi:MocR-like transcription factor YczR [Oerskovia paurometabola]|uniref:PLP-dependent aminotransferase family protein n=1 Tax=Oerskovia paurometabola TaxID=162170 RepID=A0ABW1X9X4_9CELL|nr:PLP-dependent aminotransferase family protein [Oerskovia paurometabola]MBM7497657.1 DNA-binding transcriptional MocR family regulator [Oerskovia paurometabola]